MIELYKIQIRMIKMRNKKRILKVISALIIAVLMVATFASCATGSSSSAAKDAEGTHGDNISWVYKKDGQTLTITGTGAIADFESNSDIAWGDVVTSVKKLVIGDEITEIGNYAFFGMSALEEVKLPAGLTSIGRLSFAFTTSLKTVELPAGVTTIEYGAFEASGLVSVTGKGITKIEDKAFAYCKSLDTLKFSESVSEIAENAFYEANKTKADIGVYDGTVSVTFKLVDADGNKIGEEIIPVQVGAEYVYTPKTIEGYEPASSSITVTVESTAKTVSVSYNKIQVETEPESETETDQVADPDDEKLETWEIIALAVTVCVIIGIIIGVVLFIRNDKKKSGSRTVRKNKDEKKSKGKKK